jgi:hypothetical protein
MVKCARRFGSIGAAGFGLKKSLLISLVLLASLLALAPTAGASPWNRNCRGSAPVGTKDLTNKYEFFVDQYHVSMNPGEAIRVARRLPVEEFGHHVTAREAVCQVGTGIALSAGNKWVNWGENTGWVNVHTASEAPGYVGRYHCVGIAGDGNNFERERCTAIFAGGKITGTFRIRANPATLH